jgi:hypothetical protein
MILEIGSKVVIRKYYFMLTVLITVVPSTLKCVISDKRVVKDFFQYIDLCQYLCSSTERYTVVHHEDKPYCRKHDALLYTTCFMSLLNKT